MKKTIIDFENCVSTNEIRDLLKQNLNLPEWDDTKPDDLLRILKELEPCKIYLRGTNLLPNNNIAKYMNQVIDIFDKVEELYNNIRVYVWEVVTIDFANVKSIYEIHELMSKTLDFPEWYGGNLDALWDLLTGYISSYEIHIKGIRAVHEYLQLYLQKVVEVFIKAEAKYNYHKIIVES